MNNFWKQLDKPFLALAPIAGYTDQPFRLMCKKYGVDVMYSEMISSEAIWHNRIKERGLRNKGLLKTLKLIQFSQKERPYVVQIFGADPEHMAYTAKYIASGKWGKDYLQLATNNLQQTTKKKLKVDSRKSIVELIPDGIDVNMGCPARDVTKTGAGVALMKDVELACKIVRAIKKKVKNIPVSVKTRLGWTSHDEILDFAKKIEKAGADAIAIHGRTCKEGFRGPVDWEMISQVKKTLDIPVIGNGNVESLLFVEAVDKNTNSTRRSRFNNLNNLGHNLDGYMIGTGAIGKPWIFEQIKKSCHAELVSASKRSRNKFGMTNDFIKKNILEHGKLYRDLKGDNMIEFRKVLVSYLKGLPEAVKVRKLAVKVNNFKDVEDMVKKM